MRERLKIRVEDERRRARAGLDVHPDDSSWDGTIDCAKNDWLVVRMLEGVRQALAGDPEATALVPVDAREYHLQGE